MLKPNVLAPIFFVIAIYLGFLDRGDGPIFLAWLTFPFSLLVDQAINAARSSFDLSFRSSDLIESVVLIIVGTIEFQLIGNLLGRIGQKEGT